MPKPKSYVRKPVIVEAVQVTDQNMGWVNDWCSGTIILGEGKPYIHVEVKRPLYDRQKQAYVGDWVLKTETGFRIYTDRAFKNSFDPERRPVAPKVSSGCDLVENFTD
jgi:hypothetical protein